MHQQDPAGQGMGREAGRVMRGGAGRWEALEDLRWRSQRHTRGSSAREGQGFRPEEESPGYTCCQNCGSPDGTQEGCRVRVESQRARVGDVKGVKGRSLVEDPGEQTEGRVLR